MDGLEQDAFDGQGDAVADIELAAAPGIGRHGPNWRPESWRRGNEPHHRMSPKARAAAGSGRASPRPDAGPPERAGGRPDRGGEYALRPRKAPRPGECGAVARAHPRSARLPGPCPAVATKPPAGPPGRSRPDGSSPVTRPAGPRLPSLPHTAPSGVPEHEMEVLGDRHSPRPLLPSYALPEPRPIRSAGVTRSLRYFGPIRYPADSSWPSRVPDWRVRATEWASRVAPSYLFPACQRHYPGGNGSVPVSLTSRTAVGLPRHSGGSACALRVSRPAQRLLAFWPAGSLSRPRRLFVTRVLQPMSVPP